MASTEPKVSVIVPVYNAGPSLKRSAESVLTQSYRNLELILVDDGSTDGSSETCDQLATADPRVVVIHQPNAGVSAARNAGMAGATGAYIAFVDADDTLLPEALSVVVPRLEQTQADFACFGMTFVYHAHSNVLERRVLSVDRETLLDGPDAIREQFFELFERNYWSSVWNKVFRTDFVRQHELTFDSRLAVLEDLEFVVRALAQASKVIALPEPLYDYRNDLGVSSASRRPQIDYLRSFRRLQESLDAMAAALGMDSTVERGRLEALVFRSYLTGMELLFSRRLGRRERYRALANYSTDAAVVDAARAATPTRRGVRLAATLVEARRTSLLYLLLLTNHWAKRFRNATRIIVGRVRTSVRR